MKRSLIYTLLSVWVLCCAPQVFAGENPAAFNKKILEQKLKKLSQKKQERFLDSLSLRYSKQDLAEGMKFLDFCIDYAWRNKLSNAAIANAFYRRAASYRKTGEYTRALSDYVRAEQLYSEEKDDKGLQSVYSGYAGLYGRIGEFHKAIRFTKLALEKANQNNDNDVKGISYNDLGSLYRNMKLYDSAFHFYRKSVHIYSGDKHRYQRSLITDNIGMLFLEVGQYDSAAWYNQQAFEISAPLKNSFLELQLLFNRVGIAEKTGNYQLQLASSKRALLLSDSLKIPYFQMACLGNYAISLKNLGRYSESMEYFRKMMPLMFEMNDYTSMENFLSEISVTFEKLNQPDSALHYYKMSVAIKDSQEVIAQREKVSEILARFNLEEKEKSIKSLQKQKSEEHEKGRLKSIIIWVAAGMMVVVMLLLLLVILRYRENRKLSKNLAEKQKEIVDSINYAKRIQYALLAHDDLLKKNLPEHFVLFKPKDIVSGDFYWATRASAVRSSMFNVQNQINTEHQTENTEHFYLAVCDSTGHGVPGAFMSLLNISFLNEAINEKGIEKPNEVFNHVRQRLIENISHDGAQDGMDATLVKFRISNSGLQESNSSEIRNSPFEMEYAAAHHSPVIIRNGQVISLPYDKMHIGKGESVTTFTLHTLQVQQGDMLYLFTDGYGDQFGGAGGKKFKNSQLRTLLAQIAHLPMPEQRKQLEESFARWKGNLEQIDDVCILGVRI